MRLTVKLYFRPKDEILGAFHAEGELSSTCHPTQLTLSKYAEAPLSS